MWGTHERRIHLTLGIVFTSLGVFIAADLINLTQDDLMQDDILQAQISCNSKLIQVLRDRSTARLVVDETTAEAQEALVAVLEDIQESGGTFQASDPHVVEAIRRYKIAAQARQNPELSKAYIDCSGKEISR